jgi:hypothetical protein
MMPLSKRDLIILAVLLAVAVALGVYMSGYMQVKS